MTTATSGKLVKKKDPVINPDQMVGTILVSAGRLTTKGREHILNFQKEYDLLFGEAGLHLGFLERDDIRFALDRQQTYNHVVSRQVPVSSEVLAIHQPGNPCLEAIRTVRSQLMLRWLDKAPISKCLAIVSVEARVGRSFITANLATLFAQLGLRTLLIDANLRAPRIHDIFNIDNSPGLSSLLADQWQRGAITHVSAVAGLSVLPGGPIPANPQELLSGQKFKSIIEESARNYDVILLDTPAALCGADVQILSSRAGAALLVTRSENSLAKPTIAMVSMLNQNGTSVLGAVINRF